MTPNIMSFYYFPLYIIDKISSSELIGALAIIPLIYFLGVSPRVKNFDKVFPKTLSDRILFKASETNDKPNGFVFGKWFIGHVNHDEDRDEGSVWILSTKNTFTSLVEDNSGNWEEEVVTNDISSRFENKTFNVDKERFMIINIIGPYDRRHIRFQNCKPIEAMAKPNQQRVITKIMNLRKKSQVIMLSGGPGRGKSYIADILIREILTSPKGPFTNAKEVRYTFNYSPLSPSINFSQIYQICEPTESRRLIILLDEVDIFLEKIHFETLKVNDRYPCEVHDKSSWNRFLDNFDRGYYPWTTLIMTSNKDRHYFGKLDRSFLRKGRVDVWENI